MDSRHDYRVQGRKRLHQSKRRVQGQVRPKLLLPLAQPRVKRWLACPDPNHKILVVVHNSFWAWELKTLIYHHNPGLRSVRMRCTFPKGIWWGSWYTILYQLLVWTDRPLCEVLENAIQNYPKQTKLMVRGCAAKGVYNRPYLSPYTMPLVVDKPKLVALKS